jgi:DNA invertase Pin-like site-specific DNA recombinase
VTTTNTKTAREYLRVSRDDSGRLRSPEEQHDDNRRAADAHGWTLLDPYVEDGAVSASRYGRKARPGYAALVADLEADRFGASTLLLWEPSRGSRRLSEWARLLELLEDRGVDLFVTSHGRGYDLANPRDRRSLHEDGTDSEYESGKTSVRMKRARAAEAAQGLPHGRVPYGFRREYRVIRGQIHRGVYVPDDKTTVAEWGERWVAAAKARGARPGSLQAMTSQVRMHIAAAEFGSRPMTSVRPTMCARSSPACAARASAALACRISSIRCAACSPCGSTMDVRCHAATPWPAVSHPDRRRDTETR